MAKMNVRKMKMRCDVKGCRNVDSYCISRSAEMGGVVICEDCLRDALTAIENYVEPKKKTDTKPPELFYSGLRTSYRKYRITMMSYLLRVRRRKTIHLKRTSRIQRIFKTRKRKMYLICRRSRQIQNRQRQNGRRRKRQPRGETINNGYVQNLFVSFSYYSCTACHTL